MMGSEPDPCSAGPEYILHALLFLLFHSEHLSGESSHDDPVLQAIIILVHLERRKEENHPLGHC